MAAKGTEAKAHVVDKIKQIFGSDYIGEYEKKHYVWSTENGERVQISITLTSPKNPVGEVNLSNEINFDSDENPTIAPTGFSPAEYTDEERETIERLMDQLGF